jgi:hypothetical protein
MNNNQNTIKKDNRGGKRQGAGRKKGSTNKITADEFLYAFRKKTKQDWLDLLIEKMELSHNLIVNAENDHLKQEALATAHKYDTLLARYLFTDVKQVEVDHTTQGNAIGVQLVFNSQELDDWKK